MNIFDYEKKVELSVLGSLIINYRKISIAATIINGKMFSSSSRSKIYNTMLDLYSSYGTFNAMSIYNKIGSEIHNIDEILNQCVEVAHPDIPVEMYCDELVSAFKKRVVKIYFENGLRGIDEGKPISELLHPPDLSGFGKSRILSIKDIAEEVKKDVVEHAKKDDLSCKFGIRELDELTGGVCNGDLFAIGGKPSMGKTLLAKTYCLKNPGEAVMFFPMEDTKEKFVTDLTRIKSGISPRDFSGADDVKRFLSADISQYNIDICPGISSVNEMLVAIQDWQLRNKGKSKTVIVDYLQIVAQEKDFQRRDLFLASVFQRVYSAVQRFDGKLIVLSQLREYRGKFPSMNDFAECKALSQAADKIALLCKYNDIDIINVDKVKDGSVGMFPFSFNRKKGRMTSLSPNEKRVALSKMYSESNDSCEVNF